LTTSGGKETNQQKVPAIAPANMALQPLILAFTASDSAAREVEFLRLFFTKFGLILGYFVGNLNFVVC
jgi:hypothetical protein